MEEIVLCGGKYRFWIDDKSTVHCDRYGESWRDFVGDKAVLALFRECLDRPGREALEKDLEDLEKEMVKVRKTINKFTGQERNRVLDG